ncbi:hypothetical protein GF312_06930 [Candidatus Poribacteria bacterium]|nr:hypothetical protein [Candidatus Poribacteria bacterium]
MKKTTCGINASFIYIYLSISIILIFLIPDISKADIDVSMPDIKSLPGEVFILPISISDATGQGINLIELEVGFDPELVYPEKSPETDTAIVRDDTITSDWMIAAGLGEDYFLINMLNLSPLEGSGHLVKVRFRVRDTVKFGDMGLFNFIKASFKANLTEVPAHTSNGSVTIVYNTPGLLIKALSPVDLVVTDPEGKQINKSSTEIPAATYVELDMNNDGEEDDIVIIPSAIMGNYNINVIPSSEAQDDDTYTIQVLYGNKSKFLAQDQKVADIPVEPYIFFFPIIKLKAGWNYFSTPVYLNPSNVEDALGTIIDKVISIWSYNFFTGIWSSYHTDDRLIPNRINTIDPGKSYCIQMREDGMLVLDAGQYYNEVSNLNTGWNLVSYNSSLIQPVEQVLAVLAEGNVNVFGFDNKTGKWKIYPPFNHDILYFMKPGNSYWIYKRD